MLSIPRESDKRERSFFTYRVRDVSMWLFLWLSLSVHTLVHLESALLSPSRAPDPSLCTFSHAMSATVVDQLIERSRPPHRLRHRIERRTEGTLNSLLLLLEDRHLPAVIAVRALTYQAQSQMQLPEGVDRACIMRRFAHQGYSPK